MAESDTTAEPDSRHAFPCSSCGADLTFAPGQEKLVCDFCGAETEIAGRPGGHAFKEHDFEAALTRADDPEITEDAAILNCGNCGAEVSFGPNMHATECPFCDTPYVTGTGHQRRIKPAGVLPFAISEKDARASMTKWLGRLWFAPNGLQEYARKGRAMNGVYIPFWTYDADTKSKYTGERGTIYYVTERVQVKGEDGKLRTETRQVQKIRWTPVSGRVARWFDDVLIAASGIVKGDEADAIAPFTLTGLKPFSPEYLAGFRSEAYSIGLKDGFTHARAKMATQIETDVRFDIGGDRQRIGHIDTDIRDVTFKHVLLPIWIAAYKFRGKTYRFLVNGETGKVTGERPWSWIKITLAVITTLVVLGIILVLFGENA